MDNSRQINEPFCKPTVISLFSGCGGLDLGFVMAGYKIVYANDFDNDAVRVYELNFDSGTIDNRDIRTVNAAEIPDGDVLMAGFPCQPFSVAGKRKGVNDLKGQLYKECIRIVAAKKPKVVLFENVRGMFSSKVDTANADTANVDTADTDTPKSVGDVIINELESLDYTVTKQILCASDYGVPQKRIRAFIVGVRKDLGIAYTFPPKQSKQGLTVGDVLSMPQNALNQVALSLQPKAARLIPYIPEGGSWHDVSYENLPDSYKKLRDRPKKIYSTYFRRYAKNEINGTITAAAHPERSAIIHPTENRRYTIREAARFQSFPDDFIFMTATKKDTKAMYKVIGNAVPPILAKVLADSILKQVFTK